jgi:hypothetical protein
VEREPKGNFAILQKRMARKTNGEKHLTFFLQWHLFFEKFTI